MSKKLCLKWNDFQDNTRCAFGNLREDNDFVDVTLACEDGQQIEGHKVILAASSPFFKQLLARNKHPHPLIYMRGVKFYDLVAIVEFLYFGEANIQQINLDSFLCLAEELQLQGLMERLEEKVADIETKVTSAVKRGNVSFKKQMSDEKESSTETENILAASSEPFVPFPLISGGLEKLEEEVKSLMEKGQNQSGTQKAYVCKVCGKEGYSSSIKDHIERNHVEGISVPCNQCEKAFRYRIALRTHNQRNKKCLISKYLNVFSSDREMAFDITKPMRIRTRFN